MKFDSLFCRKSISGIIGCPCRDWRLFSVPQVKKTGACFRLDPGERQYGTFHGSKNRMSKRSPHYVRAMLHMAAHNCVHGKEKMSIETFIGNDVRGHAQNLQSHFCCPPRPEAFRASLAAEPRATFGNVLRRPNECLLYAGSFNCGSGCCVLFFCSILPCFLLNLLDFA